MQTLPEQRASGTAARASNERRAQPHLNGCPPLNQPYPSHAGGLVGTARFAVLPQVPPAATAALVLAAQVGLS